MLQKRAIPCLLLKERGLVKTVGFRNPAYLGDPINIVRLFNDKEADELILLDITAARTRARPQFDYLANLASECFMPLCYGGGIRDMEDIQRLLSLGIEKVSINTAALESPDLISRAADSFGSQAIVGSIDVGRDWLGRRRVLVAGGRKATRLEPEAAAAQLEAKGVGEILLTSIERDGKMQGYDLDLIRSVAQSVSVPVVACGGAGNITHLAEAVGAGASAAAAGSLFVYQGPHRAVLISYPSDTQLRQVFGEAIAAI
jgi:cyclase